MLQKIVWIVTLLNNHTGSCANNMWNKIFISSVTAFVLKYHISLFVRIDGPRQY